MGIIKASSLYRVLIICHICIGKVKKKVKMVVASFVAAYLLANVPKEGLAAIANSNVRRVRTSPFTQE